MTATQDLLDEFAPYMPDDDGSLVTYLTAIGLGAELVESFVRDTAAGPGWSQLLDVDVAPYWALRWLGQFVGVAVAPGTPEATARQSIRTPSGWRRGTVQAIRNAVAATLTGTKTVFILERDTDPYHLTVSTYASETLDTAATTAAALSQKPAGLVMAVTTTTEHTWTTLVAHRADWNAVVAAFTDWNATIAGA